MLLTQHGTFSGKPWTSAVSSSGYFYLMPAPKWGERHRRFVETMACAICRTSVARIRLGCRSNWGPAAAQMSSRAAHSTAPEHDQHQSRRRLSDSPETEKGPGPMTRKLEEATEEAMLSGGTAGRRAVEEAGFSDELKQRLMEKMADAKFREEHKAAFVQAGLPATAGEGTRRMATAQPWTGSEPVEDAVLRMLDDAKKPLKPGLRGKYEPTAVARPPKKRGVVSPTKRAANARDQAVLYADMGIGSSKGLSEAEREEMKRELRERFQPAARSMPVSASGLAALANERIEDAIARGQFKHLPRGKAVEADPLAASPFIDTTEYLLNRMIKRQDIVPPWIEKQQELVRAARVFRERLRNDWKRHAARMMAARGGSLEEQMRRAEVHAAAERRRNAQNESGAEDTVSLEVANVGEARPFRDKDWERAESAYLKASVEKLNSLTRSYNLMAPEVARRPYWALRRELDACFAEVAPLLAEEIKQRAGGGARAAPLLGRPTTAEGRGEGFMEQWRRRDDVRIHVEAEEKAYGLREWWRDMWRRWTG
ncbi:hypothetical protein CP532_3629 [Ophiocordyceps camponoti-leonardi (nom. inval.)]|nr:hypothetical protein CP532_3629 [Ophiocordyceps camponoti-leonardi (nom. inval.)]